MDSLDREIAYTHMHRKPELSVMQHKHNKWQWMAVINVARHDVECLQHPMNTILMDREHYTDTVLMVGDKLLQMTTRSGLGKVGLYRGCRWKACLATPVHGEAV